MTEYTVSVLANGEPRYQGGAPESTYERSCVAESAMHASEQGYARIRVTVRDDGSSAYVPLA